ncbi:MAG: putative rane protein [Chthoniobacteraceae bacterium]|nr:putative rane protein [Chthoniobacteraceae bacterium]
MLWIVWVVGWIFNANPGRWGIQPREWSNLSGIFTAPLFHAGISHLLGNTISLFLLGGMIAASGTRALFSATLWAWLISGIGIFLLGPSQTNHFGASGIAFGYLGYLLARGIYQKNFINIAVSIIVLLAFSGMFFGLLPFQPGISWQGHVFGLIGGILGARKK